MSFPWGDWQDRLAVLVKGGLSAGAIANTLSIEAGQRVERSAVIGRVHRTGLQLRGESCRPKAAATDVNAGAVKAGAKRDRLGRTVHRNPAAKTIAGRVAVNAGLGFAAMKGGIPKEGTLPAESPDDQAIPEAQRCTLAQLGYGRCRWPVGEPGTPGFFFCGDKAKEGAPYCRCHLARAWTARPTRRRAAA